MSTIQKCIAILIHVFLVNKVKWLLEMVAVNTFKVRSKWLSMSTCLIPCAKDSLSISKGFPDKAPLPRGLALALFWSSDRRSKSLFSIHA